MRSIEKDAAKLTIELILDILEVLNLLKHFLINVLSITISSTNCRWEERRSKQVKGLWMGPTTTESISRLMEDIFLSVATLGPSDKLVGVHCGPISDWQSRGHVHAIYMCARAHD